MKLENLPFWITTLSPSHVWFSGNRRHVTAIDRCGFMVCSAGEATVQIGDSKFSLTPGCVLMYTPSSLVKMVSHTNDIRGMWLEVTTDFLLPHLDKVMDVSQVFMVRFNPLVVLDDEDVADLLRQMRAAQIAMDMEVASGRDKIALEIIKCRILVLVYEILDRYFVNNQDVHMPRSLHNRVLQTFVVHLFRHYRESREVSFYARLQNMTPRYFSAVIKSMSGNTASTWINNLVVSQMRQMLDDPSLSIKEVAASFNFPSQSFFGKYFKLHTGLSPKDYRRTLE